MKFTNNCFNGVPVKKSIDVVAFGTSNSISIKPFEKIL
jgi:hypothetical protein